jgi:callose synthase
MAKELYDIISRNDGSFDPLFQLEGSDNAFLEVVIEPIYRVIQNEAALSKKGSASHSEWRNYDDLNEYFW